MSFIEQWRQQLQPLPAEYSTPAAAAQGYRAMAWLAAGLLQPVRRAVQDFNLAAIGAIHELAGRGSVYILQQVQAWPASLSSQDIGELARQIEQNNDLRQALERLFHAFDITAATHIVWPAAAEYPAAELLPASSGEGVPPRVFVSYARSDGEGLARLLRIRLEEEGIPVWQDRVKMVGGRDWWLQITDALDQVAYMLLVATPGALKSVVVHREWNYARQQGVCVLPVLGGYELPTSLIPRWMRGSHFYDPDAEWPALIDTLNQPCQMPRVPFMVEALPDDFVPRQTLLTQVTGQLLDETGGPQPGCVALFGAGGYGKSSLTRAVCHDEAIREAFDDGVLWVTLGKKPGDLTERIIDLIEVLTGQRHNVANREAAENRLARLLVGRAILLVLDDVWQAAHIEPFVRSGSSGVTLLTTRFPNVIPADARRIEVSRMAPPEGLTLLSYSLPQEAQPQLNALADRLGQWPLLLSMANGTLRDRVHNNRQPLAAALQFVNRALDRRSLGAFDDHLASARNQAVAQTLGLSWELLTEEEYQRYLELAIFPEDIHIPLEVLHVWWRSTGGLSEADVAQRCRRLHQLSLLSGFDAENYYISVHKIVRELLLKEQQSSQPTLQRQFLAAQAQSLGLPVSASGVPRWADLPQSAEYLWAHLSYHLLAAGQTGQLAETLQDVRYLVNKSYLRGVSVVESDLLAARQAVPTDERLAALHQTYSQMSHLLGQSSGPGESTNILHSRLQHQPALRPLLEKTPLPRPLLTAYQPLPDLPEEGLIRTLPGHSATVLDCALSSDGRQVASIDQNAVLKLWNTETGAELLSLAAHETGSNCCAMSADGGLLVSASWGGDLKLWDGQTGAVRLAIDKAHDGPIYALAASANGQVIVSASKDKTLKVWDGRQQQPRLTLTGHNRAVTGCAITPDGRRIASVSSDGTLRLWDGDNGVLLSSYQVYEPTDVNPLLHLTFSTAASSLFSCALNRTGTIAAAVATGGRLKVYDVVANRLLTTLHGHTGWIESCAIAADDNLVVTTANDRTIKGWDLADGELRFTLEGHRRGVTCCALSGDGRLLVSGSQDRTVRLWDAAAAADQPARPGYRAAVRCCAVSADGQTAAFDTPDHGLRLVEPATAAERRLLKGHTRPINACAISAEGRLVLTAGQDRTLRLWDGLTGRLRLTLEGHRWAVTGCALSSDGRRAVSASADSTLQIWDVDTGRSERLLTGHGRAVNGCALGADDRLLASASGDQTVKVWDFAQGELLYTCAGHQGPVNDCAISPDGMLLASAGGDGTVRLWQLDGGEPLATLTGHMEAVTGCAFHPDRPYLLSVSKDKTVRLWQTVEQRCVAMLRVDGQLFNCCWQPAGERLLVAGQRGAYFLQVLW